jgi:hypothetical protein
VRIGLTRRLLNLRRLEVIRGTGQRHHWPAEVKA